jgi:hypothetical protein
LVPNLTASGLIAYLTCYILCNLGTSCGLPPISLERTLQVLVGEDRKSRSSDCFSILASSSLRRFDLALHMMLFPYCNFLKKKKNWGEFAGFLFFLAYQILHVFSSDISILCVLIYFA